MSVIPFVFANAFDELRIREQVEWNRRGPGLGICLGIIERDLNSHMTEVAPLKTLRDAQLVAVRMTWIVKPAFIVESDGFGNERIPFPSAGRITVPARTRIRWKATAICEDLPEVVELLVKDDEFVR